MVDVDDMWDDDQDDDAVRAMTFPKCKKPPVDVREYVNGLGMTDDALIEAMARAIVGVYLTGDYENAWQDFTDEAKAALSVARPIIEAQERERIKNILRKIDDASRMGGIFSLECILKEVDADAIRSDGDD